MVWDFEAWDFEAWDFEQPLNTHRSWSPTEVACE